MNVAPQKKLGSMVTKAPLNTSAPECSTVLSGVMRQLLAKRAAYMHRI